MRIIGTAASGVRAQQLAMDTVANNLANINTPGFKGGEVDFAQALAVQVGTTVATQPNGGAGGVSPSVGSGVIFNGVGTDFRLGTLVSSDNPLDLAIEGDGFFQVKLPDGQTAYTRAGDFHRDGSGQLVDSRGDVLQPALAIPRGASDIAVGADGRVSGLVNGVRQEFGQLQLVGFSNPEGLAHEGDNLFLASANSGAPQAGQAGGGAGNISLGPIKAQTLEQSNVDMATAMTDLLQAQRAYQANARLVQDGDQMWGIANSLRR
ncbi:MAG: flagellar hook-basal body protein [Desulfitobacteriaceae bacterium]